MSDLLLKNGRIIDPANNRDEVGDLLILGGVIVDQSKIDNEAERHRHSNLLEGQSGNSKSKIPEIDCSGLVISPGLIDIHVHLRQPGQSAKETIGSGTRAAAAGGFTTVVAMPNTSPPVDNPSVVTWIKEKAAAEGVVNVLPTGAITKGIAGEELAPIGSMYKAGVVALTDDGHCIQNHEVMRRALEYARMFGLVVMDHCQDYNLVGKGVMHEGRVSVELGLPGWPALGEEIIVQRNAMLAELCETPIHCQHLSSGGSVRYLRDARKRGIPLSGEVCPHHIALTDESIRAFDTNFKMNPPLRTQRDIDLLIEGIADGTITILASDHAPHCSYEKEIEFDLAPFGILGLETELGLFLDILIHKKRAIDLPRLIALLTCEPARLLALDRGTLSAGAPADVTIIDPDLEWTVDKETSFSRSRNTPFHGWDLKGRAVRTIVAGKIVWEI
ncbi:MAG TPA: dihydroorotase [Chthoniobacterales bacterium]